MKRRYEVKYNVARSRIIAHTLQHKYIFCLMAPHCPLISLIKSFIRVRITVYK